MRTYLGLILCIGVAGCGRHVFCRVDGDCPSGESCSADGSCLPRPTTCGDGVRNGDETDVDCGGSCGGCIVGKSCAAADDCLFGTCQAQRCRPASGPPFWIDEAPLPSPRAELGAAGIDQGPIYAVGGSDATGPLASVEIYDPVSRAWSAGPPLSAARASLGLAVGGDGALYAVGGSDGQKPVGTVERLAPGAATWTAAPPLPTPRSALAVGHIAGNLYALGGLDASGQPVDAVEVFDLTSWMSGAPLSLARSALAVSPPGGNQGPLYLLGGRDANGPSALVEAYPAGGSGLPPLPSAREGLAGSPDGFGSVYAIGGLAGGTESGEVDRLLPGSFGDGWEALPPLGHPRHGLAACLGSDGRVYAIGGADASGPVAFVESFGPRVTLTPAEATIGQMVTLSGDNFAAGARVATSWGTTNADGSGRLEAMTHVVEEADVEAAANGVEEVSVTDLAAVVSFNVYLRMK